MDKKEEPEFKEGKIINRERDNISLFGNYNDTG